MVAWGPLAAQGGGVSGCGRVHADTGVPAPPKAGAVGVQGEGELEEVVEVGVGADAAARRRTSFKLMDPCCLAADMGPYDAVLVSQVLEKIPSPKSLLGRLGGSRGVLRKGGLLLVTSTYAWSSEVADRQLWLGGTKNVEGKEIRSADGLAAALGPEFELVQESEVPYVLRQGGRVFQLQVAHATLWRRVA